MKYEIAVGSISWTAGKPNSMWAAGQTVSLLRTGYRKLILAWLPARNDPPRGSLTDLAPANGARLPNNDFDRFRVDTDSAKRATANTHARPDQRMRVLPSLSDVAYHIRRVAELFGERCDDSDLRERRHGRTGNA